MKQILKHFPKNLSANGITRTRWWPLELNAIIIRYYILFPAEKKHLLYRCYSFRNTNQGVLSVFDSVTSICVPSVTRIAELLQSRTKVLPTHTTLSTVADCKSLGPNPHNVFNFCRKLKLRLASTKARICATPHPKHVYTG